jgi:hypothetical protein
VVVAAPGPTGLWLARAGLGRRTCASKAAKSEPTLQIVAQQASLVHSISRGFLRQ